MRKILPILCAWLLSASFTPLCAALADSPQGQAFLDLVSTAMSEPRLTADKDAAILKAQESLAAMGSQADQMLVQVILESLDASAPGGLKTSALPVDLSPARLVCLAYYDPRSVAALLTPLTAWLDDATEGRISQLGRSGPFVRKAAYYVQRWGSEAQKAHLKQEMEGIMDKPGDVAFDARVISENGEEGQETRFVVPDDYHSSLANWCRSAVNKSRGLPPSEPADLAPSPQSAPQQHARDSRSIAAVAFSQGNYWLAGAVFAVLALCCLIWVRRGKRKVA